MLKQIALKLDDQELYKLACELEKDGATNPMQMAIQKRMAAQNPMQGLHYDRITSLAAQAKTDPLMLGKLRQATTALKQTGVQRLDDSVKQGMMAAIKKPVQMATITPLATKLKQPLNLLAKVK